MKWVTREGAKTDRVACPWLIRKFIDLQVEFLFVPNDKVLGVAKGQANSKLGDELGDVASYDDSWYHRSYDAPSTAPRCPGDPPPCHGAGD
jgi:hypothetical protein